MPDADGKLLLDSEGREILNADGTEACECCCVCNADDLPTSYVVAGHIKIYSGGALICDTDFGPFTMTTTDIPCQWQGDAEDVCGGGLVAIALQGDTCGWLLNDLFFSVAGGPSTSPPRSSPAGTFPDIHSGDLTNGTFLTDLVVA